MRRELRHTQTILSITLVLAIMLVAGGTAGGRVIGGALLLALLVWWCRQALERRSRRY